MGDAVADHLGRVGIEAVFFFVRIVRIRRRLGMGRLIGGIEIVAVLAGGSRLGDVVRFAGFRRRQLVVGQLGRELFALGHVIGGHAIVKLLGNLRRKKWVSPPSSPTPF